MNPEKSFFTNLIETTKEIINTFSSELKEAKKSVTKEIANNNLKTPDIVSGKENKNNQEKTENEAVIKSRQETAQLFVETTEQLQYNAIFAEYLQKTLARKLKSR